MFRTEDISDCAIWTPPHFFQLEFFNPSFVRCNCGTLNANIIFFDCLCTINGDLVIGFITVLNAKIEGMQFQF